MGKIIEKVQVKNFIDLINMIEGKINESQIKTEEFDAVIDTDAIFLCLPPDIISKLGLIHSHSRKIITANGEVMRRIFSGAVITIQGRETQMSVMENDQTTPPLLGYLVLEDLDLVPDLKAQKLIPNPAHDGKWITDLL